LVATIDNQYGAIVIGSGPGGYAAAIKLGLLGIKTLCIEKEPVLGGVCLNWGCIPSKALISATKLKSHVEDAKAFGLQSDGLFFDIEKLKDWKDGIVKKMNSGVAALIKNSGGRFITQGTATVLDANSVRVTRLGGEAETYSASKGIIIATGASPIILPGFEPDGRSVITSKEAIHFKDIPKHLLILGGGVIGIELSSVYQRLGSKVTIVEISDRILPGTDPDLAKVVEGKLRRNSVEIRTRTRALGCEKAGSSLGVTLQGSDGQCTMEVDRVLVAVGFRPNSQGLGLEELGVRFDAKGHIAVDLKYQTSVPHIYAIGDVACEPYLAHKATKEAEIAAEVIAGKKSERSWEALPAAIFSDPEIATVGLNEQEARLQGYSVTIGKFPFVASGRALAIAETEGFIKVLVDSKNDRILGVGIVGPEASELIAEVALGMEMGAVGEDVALTIHTHPTLSEGLMEAFKQALGEAINIANPRRLYGAAMRPDSLAESSKALHQQ